MQVKDPDALRLARKARRYSQRDLAGLVRRSHTTIYALERGKLRTITEDLAMAIASRLDVPWEDLFVNDSSDVRGVAIDSRSDCRVAS